MIRITLVSLCIIHTACANTESACNLVKKQLPLEKQTSVAPDNLESRNILQKALSFFNCRTFSAESFWLFEDDDIMLQDALGDLQMSADGEFEDILY